MNLSKTESRYMQMVLSGLMMLGIIALLTSYFVGEKKRIKFCTANCEADKQLGINGTITKIFLGPGARGTKTIRIFQDNEWINYRGGWHPTLNYLQIGDSIYKKSGLFDFEIYRDGKMVQLISEDCYNCEKGCKGGFRYCNE